MSIALIELALLGVERAVELFRKLQATARQSGELTAEQSKAFDERMARAFASDHWKTDDQQQ